MGCDAVGWQGATTLRAYAREEEQRGQRAAARLNRVRSALTQPVKVVVRKKANIHAVYPAEESGQLPFLGSWCFDSSRKASGAAGRLGPGARSRVNAKLSAGLRLSQTLTLRVGFNVLVAVRL